MPIFDQGYQHWHGPLSGHGWRWLTIARHGVRVQSKNRILRLLLLCAWIPALALVGSLALWGLIEQGSETLLALVQNILPAGVVQDPRAYRGVIWTLAYSFFFKVEMYFIMLLTAIAGPGLISQDLRFNALPMYFARPLNRLDYFLGKLGVIGALVASVAVGPAVFAYLVGVCFSLDLSVVKDTYPVLFAGVAYGLVVTLSVGTLILALSSLSRRSLYIGIAWAGLWIISTLVGEIMTEVHGKSVLAEAQLSERNRWLDEHPPPKGVQIIELRNRHMSVPQRQPAMQFVPNEKGGRIGRMRLAGLRPEQEKEGERWYNEYQNASGQAWSKAQENLAAAKGHDWRPICSYTTNLERIADQLFDTDSAWVSINKAFEQGLRMKFGPRAKLPPRRLADRYVLQYPWTWSAGILAALLGISTWILIRRVKSLDRLK